MLLFAATAGCWLSAAAILPPPVLAEPAWKLRQQRNSGTLAERRREQMEDRRRLYERRMQLSDEQKAQREEDRAALREQADEREYRRRDAAR